jgi:catechol 2,3-dioxygenase-like lactoylglutathione lyase family enzyme
MPKIGHIAISSRHPGKAADFFKEVFGFREVSRHGLDPSKPDEAPNPSVVAITDGTMNITFLKVDAAIMGCEDGFIGLQHFGVVVEDLDAYRKKLEAMGYPVHVDADALPKGANVEVKFKAPDGVVFDISPHPWPGTKAGHGQ